MISRYRKCLLVVLIALLLTACGSGSSGDGPGQNQPPAQQSSGNWDQLVWDKDHWQ